MKEIISCVYLLTTPFSILEIVIREKLLLEQTAVEERKKVAELSDEKLCQVSRIIVLFER
jgi:uncharacterized OsmC-like protein